MATQLGNISITGIEHESSDGYKSAVVRGRLESLHNGQVGDGNGLAAMILWDALSELAGRDVKESLLLAEIIYSEFAKPDEKESDFFITANLLKDPNLLDGLTTGSWESYYVG